MSTTGQRPGNGEADGTMNVAQRSTSATKSIIKSMLDMMMSNKLLTRENHTPELDAAVKELVREIETVIRTNLLNFGNQVAEQPRHRHQPARPHQKKNQATGQNFCFV